MELTEWEGARNAGQTLGLDSVCPDDTFVDEISPPRAVVNTVVNSQEERSGYGEQTAD